tara:strand:- start:5579 stop:5854 length:276 start_codon:yes stop_codon:yes gene_type:complete
MVVFDICYPMLYLFRIRLVLETWDSKKSIWSARIVLPLRIKYSILDGTNGTANKVIPDCSNVLFPLWLLHLLQDVTVFIHESFPPLERGMI